MPKHTTKDPAQRALDIAVGEADRIWAARSIDSDFDYFGHIVDNSKVYLTEFDFHPISEVCRT